MKVLAINSSAGKDGNTAILIEKIFEILSKEGIETEMLQLGDQVIEPSWFPCLYGEYLCKYAGLIGESFSSDRYEP